MFRIVVSRLRFGAILSNMDIISSISSAIATGLRLKEVGDKVKNADFRNLLADLNLKLAEIKTQLAEVIEKIRD